MGKFHDTECYIEKDFNEYIYNNGELNLRGVANQ